jgi:hypothetical protein
MDEGMGRRAGQGRVSTESCIKAIVMPRCGRQCNAVLCMGAC